MSISKQEEGDLSRQLAETMSLNFENGDIDQSMMRHWLQELVNALMTDSQDDEDSNVEQTADRIVQNALETYRREMQQRQDNDAITRTSTDESKPKTTTKSFSLLDSLMASSALPPRIDWDEITQKQNHMSPKEILDLLRQIQYVDDVAHDWELVKGLLWNGWNATLMTTDGEQRTDRRSYLRLIQSWFEKCDRNSTWLRYDLCRSVVQALRHYTYHRSKNNDTNNNNDDDNEFMWELVNAWYIIWSQSHFNNDQAKAIVWSVLLLMRVKQTKAGMITPAECLALRDGRATWFQRFLKNMSPRDTLEVVNGTEWLQDAVSDLQSSSQTTVTTKLQQAVRIHKLCMVRSVLVNTRLTFFPWPTAPPKDLDMEELVSERTRDNDESELRLQTKSVEEIIGLGKLFLGMLRADTLPNASKDIVEVVSEVCETLLWGCLDDGECLQSLLNLILFEGTTSLVRGWNLEHLRILLQLLKARDWDPKGRTYEIIVMQINHLPAVIDPSELESLGIDDKATLARVYKAQE